jgi:hypothetical protein
MGFWSNIFGKGGSYFLDDESAKGMGDTEYMKQSKAVRRTFPAGGGEEEFEMTRQVSATDKTVFDSRKGGVAPAAKSAPVSSSSFGNSSSFGAASSFGSASSFGGSASNFGGTTEPTAAPADAAAAPADEAAPAPSFQPNRSTNVDSSMDMFRNMAKNVGR